MTKVKICGLQTSEQVHVAEKSGADYLGFVFARSKRRVDPTLVRNITATLSPNIKKVGVFVSPTLNELLETIKVAHIDVIQLHGELSTCVTEKLTTNYFKEKNIETIQAFNGQEKRLSEKLKSNHTDFILLDAPSYGKKYAGGNGQVFDWKQASQNISENDRKRLILAGGLTKHNVKKACEYFSPFGVDVSSGVETNGEKDLKKIEEFIKCVKEEKNV